MSEKCQFRHMSFDPAEPYDDLPDLPPPIDIETKAVLNACARATAALAALRQATALIPNPAGHRALSIRSDPCIDGRQRTATDGRTGRVLNLL
jgi:hypothetical protein